MKFKVGDEVTYQFLDLRHKNRIGTIIQLGSGSHSNMCEVEWIWGNYTALGWVDITKIEIHKQKKRNDILNQLGI